MLQALVLLVADVSWIVQDDNVRSQGYNGPMDPLPEERPLDLGRPEQQPGRL